MATVFVIRIRPTWRYHNWLIRRYFQNVAQLLIESFALIAAVAVFPSLKAIEHFICEPSFHFSHLCWVLP